MIFITVFLSICCGFVGCFPLKQQVDVAEFERELAGLRSTDDNGQFITPSVQLSAAAHQELFVITYTGVAQWLNVGL